MDNPADLLEVCKHIIAAVNNGAVLYDEVAKTAYEPEELVYELALFYVSKDGK